MACVNEKGKLTASAKALLTAILTEAKTAEDIAEEIKKPLFKIRSSLRDMKSMGFVNEDDAHKYMIDERAKKLLDENHIITSQ